VGWEGANMKVKRSVFTVKTYECQASNQMHMHSLMHHIQEIASKHADELDFGMEWMRLNNVYWVLVNFRMELNRLPAYNQTVILRTWPSGADVIKAFREFVGEDLEGNVLFKASSDWMIIDRNSMRPRDPSYFDLDIPDHDERVIGEIKRLLPKRDYNELGRIRVPYSSIDVNGHVNNCEYVRWGTDTIRIMEKDLEPKFRSMHITFSSEVFEGEDLILEAVGPEDGLIAVRGKKAENGKNAYLMEMEVG